MNKGYKILLNKEKSVLATNINEEININIENTTQPLPLGDVEHTVNAFEQFEKERAESTKYRFYGTINPMISNMLYNDNVFIINGNHEENSVYKKEQSNVNFLLEMEEQIPLRKTLVDEILIFLPVKEFAVLPKKPIDKIFSSNHSLYIL